MLDEFCAAAGSKARVIHVLAEPVGLTGKQAALDLAFEEARGDVLLFTDGDCLLPPTWVEEMRAHFTDARVGVVLGRIELERGALSWGGSRHSSSPCSTSTTSGSAGSALPTGCFGNNMAIRAAAVQSTGGFRELGYSVTEDALLLDAVSRGGGWKVRTCISSRGAALTVPMGGWREYVHQHTRWNAGGLFSRDPFTRVSFILVVLIYLVGSLLVIPLGFLDWRVPILSLNSFLSIGILAFIGGFYEGKRRGQYFLRFLPYLLFFGFFYSFITLRALLRRPFEWKGAALRP